MSQMIDDELVKGCQRYLDELQKRSRVVEQRKQEQAKAEELKAARREQWRKFLYDDNQQGVTVLVPDKSQLKK